MPGTLHRRAAVAAVLVVLAIASACLGAAGAAGRRPRTEGGVLVPKGKQVYFGVSDTGDPANFGEFSKPSPSTRR